MAAFVKSLVYALLPAVSTHSQCGYVREFATLGECPHAWLFPPMGFSIRPYKIHVSGAVRNDAM